MHYPKIKYIDMPLELECDMIYGFVFCDDWGWGKYILKKHPGLKGMRKLKTEEERIGFIREYVTGYRKANKELMERNKAKYQKDWAKIEKGFYRLLSEIMEIEWPKSRKTVAAMFSVNTISPRFLDKWSFSLYVDYKKPTHAREVIMHELCHFLYFEKWKKLFPKMRPKRFDSPYIEWHLSEIIAPIILNDKKVRKLLKHKAGFYEEHERVKIGNKNIPQIFAELYGKRKSFDEFLLSSYELIKRKEGVIKK